MGMKQFPLPPNFAYGSATVIPSIAVTTRHGAWSKQDMPAGLPVPAKQLGQELGGGPITQVNGS